MNGYEMILYSVIACCAYGAILSICEVFTKCDCEDLTEEEGL